MSYKLRNIMYGLALTGLSIFGINCDKIPNQETNKINFYYPGIKILSKPVVGEVGQKYESKIETNRKSDCSIIDSPSWLKMNDNTLQGTPVHISNDEVGREKVKVKCSDGVYSDAKEFDLEIEPGIYKNKLYDHIQPISLDGNSIEDIILLCESDFCPDVFRDNNDYLEKRAEGIKNAISELYNISGLDFLYLPVEIHLNNDTTCTPNSFIANTSGLNIICDHLYNWIGKKISLLGHSDCLDPRYPEACIDEDTYINPNNIDANGSEIHEATHLKLLGKMPSGVQESFAYPLQYILSNNNGFKNFSSFCELKDSTIGMDDWNNIFLYDLCTDFGFDINNINIFFSKLNAEYNKGIYAPNKPIPNGKIKCIMDSAVGENTYYYFVDDICNNPINPTYCNFSNPASGYYINSDYCGDLL